MSMPMSPATCGFCEVARMAMPSFVRYTSARSPAIIAIEVTMIAICTLEMAALVSDVPRWTSFSSMICGKAMMLRLQTRSARCCSTMETPMAVMSGASRGALRSGR